MQLFSMVYMVYKAQVRNPNQPLHNRIRVMSMNDRAIINKYHLAKPDLNEDKALLTNTKLTATNKPKSRVPANMASERVLTSRSW